MDYEGWVAGYKVRAINWIDGKNIYLNIAYYAPGASLSRPPAQEKSFLLPKEQEELIRTNLHSVVVNLMTPPEYRQSLSPVQKPESKEGEAQMRLSPNDPQVKEALKILNSVCGYEDAPNLSGYLQNVDFLDPCSIEDLKALASELSHMSPGEMRCFSGILDAESVNGIKDVLRLSKSLEDYTFLPNICTETELGQFLVCTGHKNFSEDVQPYLDYRRIGVEYYAERGGAFTATGYVQRKSPDLTQKNRRAPSPKGTGAGNYDWRDVKMDEGWLEFLRQQFPKGSRVRLDLPLQSQKDRETGCHGILTGITEDGNLRMQRHNGELLDVPFSKGLTVLPPLTHTLKLYMPLTADIFEYDDHNGIEYDPVEIDGEALREYEGQIIAALRDKSLPVETDRGLMVWFDGEDSVDRKVWSANFNVEDRDGQLWGVAECQVTGDLEPEELDELKEYLSGQASDGWGESFEQQTIRVDGTNELYVHFWSCEKEWSIQTEEECFGPKFAEGLPELCFSTLASTGDLIIIKRGETGYYPSTWNTPDRAENKRLADYNNAQLGVTSAQRRAMEIGSMAGWDVPGADPAYNEAEQQMGGMSFE